VELFLISVNDALTMGERRNSLLAGFGFTPEPGHTVARDLYLT
jgi:hypothetical protein